MGVGTATGQSEDRIRWQHRLLPFMTAMLAGLTLFFFTATLWQLVELEAEIRREPTVTLSAGATTVALPQDASVADRIAVARFRAEAEMEVQVVARRYRQGTILLMSRVWTHYLGFVTGMILALVGAAFILGKLRDTGSEVGLKSAAGDWNVKSASPGIVLASLGTILILITVVTHHRIDVVDGAVYLRNGLTADLPPLRVDPPRLTLPKNDLSVPSPAR